MSRVREEDGRSPSGRAGGPTDLSRPAASQPKALIPNAECEGKRSFSSREWAQRGVRAIEGEHQHDSRRGRLHVYRCDTCQGWHIGRGFKTKMPKHRQQSGWIVDEEALSKSAAVFRRASEIARMRFPGGASAGELSKILREVLAEKSPPPSQRQQP